MQIALGNILKFRKKNWQFDFIGGIIYFVLSFSMFPQVCSIYFFLLFRSMLVPKFHACLNLNGLTGSIVFPLFKCVWIAIPEN